METTPTRHRHHVDGGGPRRGRSHQEVNSGRGSHPHLRCVKGGDPTRDGDVSHQRRAQVEGQIRTGEGVSTAVYTDGSKNKQGNTSCSFYVTSHDLSRSYRRVIDPGGRNGGHRQ